jgi:hypothetical protein
VKTQHEALPKRPGGTDGQASRARVVVLAGRAEAARLCRNPLVLAGLAVAASLIWWNSRTMVPQWWVWDVQIGSTLLAVAAPVLVASQLGAGRVRRDGASQLYASYPTSSSARTAAHLLGLAGPLALATALAGAAVAWLNLLGPVGTPRLAVLAQGLLLVALGGAAGVALGCCLPSPMAGILTVTMLGVAEVDLIWPFGGPVRLPGTAVSLFPWVQPAVLHWLPGPVSSIPPGAHMAWLAALTGLAAIAALWRPSSPARLTRPAALAAAACLGLAGWSGWAQARPVSLSLQERLVYQATHPARAELCVTRQGVRYCAYPLFRPDVARWATVVDGVLGRLPRRPGRALIVRQVVDANFVGNLLSLADQPSATSPDRATLRLGAELDQFIGAQSTDPHLVPGSSVPPVYVSIDWGVGGMTGPYQLGLAIQVAWWTARLPTTWQRTATYGCGRNCLSQAMISCLPVGQAREAIALWLAASATPATRTAFAASLRFGPGVSKVGGTWVSSYPGVLAYGYFPAVQFTGQGAALAEAMLRLPQRRVEAVLAARWPGWLSPRATDTQLAHALRIRLPAAPPPHLSASNRGQPADPVCQ